MLYYEPILLRQAARIRIYPVVPDFSALLRADPIETRPAPAAAQQSVRISVLYYEPILLRPRTVQAAELDDHAISVLYYEPIQLRPLGLPGVRGSVRISVLYYEPILLRPADPLQRDRAS